VPWRIRFVNDFKSPGADEFSREGPPGAFHFEKYGVCLSSDS